MRRLAAFAAGFVFGVGLAVSQMVNPAKVVGFLDVAGDGDPSLKFVMGGALAVTGVAFRWVLKRPAPLFERRFYLPTARAVDGKLVAGAAIFGVGWGISGFCPGPAVASLAYGLAPSALFVASMLAGMALHRVSPAPQGAAAPAPPGDG